MLHPCSMRCDTSIGRKLEGSGGIVELEDNERERGEREKRERKGGRGKEENVYVNVKINV